MKLLIIAAGTSVLVLAVLAATHFMNQEKPSGSNSGLEFGNKIFIGRNELHVGIASTFEAKARGLSGHPGLNDSQGLLFDYASSPGIPSFWMKEMMFPIDIIWIRDNVVVDISRDLPVPAPGTTEQNLPRYSPAEPVDTVVEVAAGWSARHNVEPGTNVER